MKSSRSRIKNRLKTNNCRIVSIKDTAHTHTQKKKGRKRVKRTALAGSESDTADHGHRQLPESLRVGIALLLYHKWLPQFECCSCNCLSTNSARLLLQICSSGYQRALRNDNFICATAKTGSSFAEAKAATRLPPVLLFYFLILQLCCPTGISPTGNSGCFAHGKPAAKESCMLGVLVFP